MVFGIIKKVLRKKYKFVLVCIKIEPNLILNKTVLHGYIIHNMTITVCLLM